MKITYISSLKDFYVYFSKYFLAFAKKIFTVDFDDN